jgi:hypothetical protein
MQGIISLVARVEARHRDRSQGNWFPACNGTETPFLSRSGKRLLYVYQPSTGNHAYIDMGTDMVLTDEEARQALQTY